MRRLVLAALVVPAAFPALASAQFAGPIFPPSQEEYGAGITVSGVGFAPLGDRDRTTARAMGDARRRAEAIATALGVSLGEVRAAEVATPFEPRPECGQRRTRRCAPLDAVTVEATFAIVGGPADDEGARELKGTGIGTASSEPERRTSPAIRRSLRAARLAATPGAAEAAQANAQSAATASGVPLGQLFSVVEPVNLYGYEPLLGVFGPGQFCGSVRRFVIRRDPETGERRPVRGKRVRRCFSPRRTLVRLEVTYLGG
jgi:Protein of unknown function (DUF541)